LMSGGRTAAPVAAVLEVDGSEPSLDLDVAAGVRAGARALRFLGPVRLSADEPCATLAAVRLMREAAADGVAVIWNGSVGDGITPRLLVHLPPPQPAGSESDTADTAEWRRRYRPGLCYYRLGPDFVFIKDVRTPEDSGRFRLDGVVDAFRSLEAVVDVTNLDSPTRGLVDDLEAEHLVLRFGDLATLLPNRMRRWPVPALEV
jgi:hypothetical protein